MATSKAYLLDETALEFKASGGDVLFTCTSLAAGAGRQSAEHDLGATARAYMFEWRAYTKFATAPVVDEYIDVYLKTSDGAHDDNDDGSSDSAVSAENKLKNLKYIGSIVVDEASTTPEFSSSGIVKITSRYFQIVFWNGTADAFSGTAADHGLSLKPFSIQGQAA